MNAPQSHSPKIPWHYVYYVLALFNVITVCTSIYFNHRLLHTFNAAVDESKEWAETQADIIRLSSLSTAMNAPGNDVFRNLDVEGERQKFNTHFDAYHAQFKKVDKLVHSEKEWAASYPSMLASLKKMDVILHEIQHEASHLKASTFSIFDALKQDDVAQAAAYMADMDQAFSQNARQIDQLSLLASEALKQYSIEQNQKAQLLKNTELLIALGALIMVVLALAYGHVLIKKINSHERELINHRDHLQTLVNLQTHDLLEQKNRAEAASRAKSEFLSNMSHELRTPMHAILNYAHMGLTQPEPAPKEKTEKYFRHIHLAGSRLLELLNNLLDLAKMESGKMSFSLKEADFLGVLDQSLAELDSLLKEKQLTIHKTQSSHNTQAVFDNLRMIQVVINIMSNAIRYSPVGSSIDIHLSDACLPVSGDALCLSITNQGESIPSDEIESIFDQFIQSSTTKTGAGGTGLGLSICREIVQTHNGKIWAENITDHGVAFHILIPKQTNPTSHEVSHG